MFWAFVIFCVCFVICLALYIDALIYLRKKRTQEKPVKLAIKEVKEEKPQPEVNVVMSGNIEQKLSKQETIKQKLGLSRRTLAEPIAVETPKQPDPRKLEGEELKKYLLTPPELDVNKFFSESARSYARNGVTNDVFKREMDRNIDALKRENANPIISDSTPMNVSTCSARRARL